MHTLMQTLAIGFTLNAADPMAQAYNPSRDLSDQKLLERMVGYINGIHNFVGIMGRFTDIKGWEGLQFNEDGRVEGMNWFQFFSGGNIDLHCIPSSMRKMTISDNKLDGSLDTKNLPRGMTHFAAGSNRLTGTFCMATLPEGMEVVGISSNRFEGTLNVAAMPKTMKEFRAGSNKFFGNVDLSRLPEGLTDLSLGDNEFSGEIDLAVIPPGMRRLLLSENNIEQDELVVGEVPESVKSIDLHGNRIGRVVGLDGEKKHYKVIHISKQRNQEFYQ